MDGGHFYLSGLDRVFCDSTTRFQRLGSFPEDSLPECNMLSDIGQTRRPFIRLATRGKSVDFVTRLFFSLWLKRKTLCAFARDGAYSSFIMELSLWLIRPQYLETLFK